MKDFVVHTEGVVKAMEILICEEGGEEDTLIPAAILHDVGFSLVDKELQTNLHLEKKREAQRQHLLFAKELIPEILTKLNYPKDKIDLIVEIVAAHKFQDPKDHDKRMLIDADNLSDVFKEQFYTDVVSYESTPQQVYNYRLQNKYYFSSAEKIAKEEMKMRLEEIKAKS